MPTPFPIFWETTFVERQDQLLSGVAQKIRQESAQYLLHVNEDEYVRHLKSERGIDPLVIHFDKVEASSEEGRFAPPESPFSRVIPEGQTYPGLKITYHLPFTGDPYLLQCRPNLCEAEEHLADTGRDS